MENKLLVVALIACAGLTGDMFPMAQARQGDHGNRAARPVHQPADLAPFLPCLCATDRNREAYLNGCAWKVKT